MQPHLRKLRINESRLFEPLHKLILIADSVGIASIYALRGVVEPIEETPRNATAAECIQFPTLVVRFPILTTLRATVTGSPLTELTLGVVERKPPPPLPPGRAQSTIKGHGGFALILMTPIYVDFFEKHRLWIRATFGGDPYAWPGLLNFARCLRNFISHTAGHVHFENKNAGPVRWRNLQYSPADEGRKVLAADIDIGDLILLMCELSDLLDQHNCPLSP
jgi:hypothetical protein